MALARKIPPLIACIALLLLVFSCQPRLRIVTPDFALVPEPVPPRFFGLWKQQLAIWCPPDTDQRCDDGHFQQLLDELDARELRLLVRWAMWMEVSVKTCNQKLTALQRVNE